MPISLVVEFKGLAEKFRQLVTNWEVSSDVTYQLLGIIALDRNRRFPLFIDILQSAL